MRDFLNSIPLHKIDLAFFGVSQYNSRDSKSIRTWLSLVERLLWEQDAAGSNPVVRTIQPKVALEGGLWLLCYFRNSDAL